MSPISCRCCDVSIMGDDPSGPRRTMYIRSGEQSDFDPEDGVSTKGYNILMS